MEDADYIAWEASRLVRLTRKGTANLTHLKPEEEERREAAAPESAEGEAPLKDRS